MNVRSMTTDDEVAAIDAIVLAFVGDPMTRWVWPNSHQYLAAMPRFVRAFGGAAFSRGGAFCSDDYAGVALWLPPAVHPDEERLGELMETTGSPAAREAGPAIFEQMAKYHPTEPHWYLPLIGVDPAHQGRGHGDALMRYTLERFDREKLPAYWNPPIRGIFHSIVAMDSRSWARYRPAPRPRLPRWRKNIEWAKQRAVVLGLVLRPNKSGRGIRGLTARAAGIQQCVGNLQAEFVEFVQFSTAERAKLLPAPRHVPLYGILGVHPLQIVPHSFPVSVAAQIASVSGARRT